jgi:hypothetical protein
MTNIHERIEEELVQARKVCNTPGASSGECAAAWDAVEELQAEAAHQQTKTVDHGKNSLQQYCDDNPDAVECRIYED